MLPLEGAGDGVRVSIVSVPCPFAWAWVESEFIRLEGSGRLARDAYAEAKLAKEAVREARGLAGRGLGIAGVLGVDVIADAGVPWVVG